MYSLLDAVIADGDPAARLRALRKLRTELESLETETAADALRGGLSWRSIGDALGISKQAAHRRHSHSVSELDLAAATDHHGSPVVVTPEARLAVRIARREALVMGTQTVGTEHLLLGLLQCRDTTVDAVFRRLGVTASRAKTVVSPTVQMPVEQARGLRSDSSERESQAPRAPVSPLARQALQLALTVAIARGAQTLGPIDMLSGVLDRDEAGATRTLSSLGVSSSAVLSEIDRLSGPIRAERPL